ncbi:Uncharacterized protein PBTT_02555 [Plasmodiophora brassicae]|uniref:Uncharacterized protein n=1 Tax=Plasmodiophora brassicae TaxID=37360 RepID=A0A3P3Y4W2_PLABS|nr:unnamed protein product [Plasmodiophora brassicae]
MWRSGVMAVGPGSLVLVRSEGAPAPAGVKPAPPRDDGVAPLARGVVFRAAPDVAAKTLRHLRPYVEEDARDHRVTPFEVFVAFQPDFELLDLSDKAQVGALVRMWNALPASARQWYGAERHRLATATVDRAPTKSRPAKPGRIWTETFDETTGTWRAV